MAGKGSILHVHREHHKEMLPVWFFIGMLLLFYGAVILIVGIRSFSHPPAVALASYHADLWGGIALTIIGGVFVRAFIPRRKVDEVPDAECGTDYSQAEEAISHRENG